MDDALNAWLRQRRGVPLRSRRPLSGGCIHHAWRLELADGCCLFLKTNRAAALPLLEAEADGLRALAAAAPPRLQLPAVLACERVGDQALLLLSWLELDPVGTDGGWHQLGHDLASLHRNSLQRGRQGDRFGWACDNFIGTTPQPNRWHDDWGRFFVEQRLRPQLRLAQGSGHPLLGAEALLEQGARWLADHSPEPVLVHGDLWSGNAGLISGAAGAIFDPAVYRGDREVDLAMARLFGGFPAAFFSGYNAAWPLSASASRRVDLYNLYHLLNHANLFGGGYRNQAQALISALLA